MKGVSSSKLELLRRHIQEYPGFPKPGILFRDIFGIFKNVEALTVMQEVLVNHIRELQPKVDCIIGLDSRGFLFGPMVSLALQIPFYPIRKKGKLPGKVTTVTYELEYGSDSLEIQTDSIPNGCNTLIIDDLLATGGTLKAACDLVKLTKSNIVECLVIIELLGLEGRQKIPASVHSIIQYP